MLTGIEPCTWPSVLTTSEIRRFDTYAGPNMFRSIEMMLGLDPLNKFDACAYPLEHCFTDTLDLTPFKRFPQRAP